MTTSHKNSVDLPVELVPHLAPLAAALAAYRGSIQARRPQAATPSVATELDSLVARESAVLTELARAVAMPEIAVKAAQGHRVSPASAVAAFAAALVPLDQALLADLGVARGLTDRAHVAQAAAGASPSADALEATEEFYRAWAEWELAAATEIAAGAVARLVPTPAQRAAEKARRLAGLPARATREITERVTDTAADLTHNAAEQARGAATDVANRVNAVVVGTTEVVDRARTEVTDQATRLIRISDAAWTAGRDAALRDGEQEAQRTGSDNAAEVLHSTRESLGVVDEQDLPIKGYDALTVRDAGAAIQDLTDQHDLRVVDAYERAHKNRKTVVDAVQERSSSLV